MKLPQHYLEKRQALQEDKNSGKITEKDYQELLEVLAKEFGLEFQPKRQQDKQITKHRKMY